MIRLARISRLRRECGQTAVEFSLCALVFFMIVFGLLKVATIYGDYVALQHAARDGSRKGSVTRGTGNADSTAVTNAVTTAVKASSSFLSPTAMGITVTGCKENAASRPPSAQPPISEEFERVVREMSLGVALQPALGNLVRRVKSEDLELMVTAINIQSQVGGNLATVLDSIAFTIRERIRIIGEIRVLTSMQRYSGYVITLLPVGLAGILFLVSPSYITSLFRNPPVTLGLPTGVIFLIVGLISMGIGYVFIRRIVDIKV